MATVAVAHMSISARATAAIAIFGVVSSASTQNRISLLFLLELVMHRVMSHEQVPEAMTKVRGVGGLLPLGRVRVQEISSTSVVGCAEQKSDVRQEVVGCLARVAPPRRNDRHRKHSSQVALNVEAIVRVDGVNLRHNDGQHLDEPLQHTLIPAPIPLPNSRGVYDHYRAVGRVQDLGGVRLTSHVAH